MADAKKCDVCSKFYERYNTNGKGNHNGIRIVQVDSVGRINAAQTRGFESLSITSFFALA